MIDSWMQNAVIWILSMIEYGNMKSTAREEFDWERDVSEELEYVGVKSSLPQMSRLL
jgi:hypothetical protein